ncbi:DUF222 domain-containing protein [Rhodococcus jostii]|uniref:DUF222 domain-containing protein n=1 Tax=Rhodococcus jostii TaxID=132919 RepID=UPI003665D826
MRAKREKAQADSFVGVGAAEDGMCRILGPIPAAQGRAFDARLREPANTVCPKDLRTYELRRADGLSALIDGVGFVHCECGRVDCGKSSRIATTARKPLVHLIMLDSTLAGRQQTVSRTPRSNTPVSNMCSTLAKSPALHKTRIRARPPTHSPRRWRARWRPR